MNAASLPLPSIRPVKLSYGDLLLLPDDGKRHELLDGEHVVTHSPSRRHQTVVLNLIRRLDEAVNAAGGILLPAPFDVVLSPHDVAAPDLLFVSRHRLDRLADANLQGAPDLVIEVLSPETAARDQELKRRVYGRFGVLEYWLVDAEEAELVVIRFDHHPAAISWTLRADDLLQTSLVPGLCFPVRALFEDRGPRPL
jgi:Uma2 family endonuclease